MRRVPSTSQHVQPAAAASDHGTFEQTLRAKLHALQCELLRAFDEEVGDLRRQRQQRDQEVPTSRRESPARDDHPAGAAVAPDARLAQLPSPPIPLPAGDSTSPKPPLQQRVDPETPGDDGTADASAEGPRADVASAGQQEQVLTEPVELTTPTSDLLPWASQPKAINSSDNRPRFVVREEIHEACEASLQIGYHQTKMVKQLRRQFARDMSDTPALRWYVISLYSPAIATWNWLCFSLLFKDLVLLPMEAAFMLHALPGMATTVLDIMTFLSPVMWTCDIVLTFFTSVETRGEQVGDLRVIRWRYLKTWFFIDASVVLMEWWTWVSRRPGASLLHAVRWLRLLRCCRIGRYPVIKAASKALGVPVGSTWLVIRVLGLSAVLGVTMHWVSCGFFLVFDRPGTPEHYPNSADDVLSAYTAAMYWACGTLTGGLIDVPHTLAEHVFTIIARTVVMVLHVTVVGLVCYDVSACYHSDSVFMTRIARDFLDSHTRSSLKPQTEARLRNFVASHHMRGESDKMRDVSLFLKSLPECLRMDLNYDVRGATLRCIHFFAHIDVENSRVLREVADKVMVLRLTAANDFVFFAGDPGLNAYICSTGELCYIEGGGESSYAEPTSWSSIRAGGWLSEASLWTHWEHCGTLTAKTSSAVFTLEAEPFYNVLHDFAHLGVIAVKYARCFVKYLNKHAEEISDYMDFNSELTDFLDTHVSGPMLHYAFISHHKKDAGPEAALMQAGLEAIIEMDVSHPANDLVFPIFVDSENLGDLRHLQEHVKSSQNMFLLLTKDVLSRPWCLVEIYTAHQQRVPIVPVLISREGVTFEYPDESFYNRLADGTLLPASQMRLLKREGVDVAILAEAIRGVCSVIAMTFSPNKDKALRSTELTDIMARTTESGDTTFGGIGRSQRSTSRPKSVDPQTRLARHKASAQNLSGQISVNSSFVFRDQSLPKVERSVDTTLICRGMSELSGP